MALFKEILGANETLFKNPVALDIDYIPKLIPYREKEQHYMASCIKPLFQKRNGRNLLIHGSPGVGKTVACRHVLEELGEYSEEIAALYINCWQKNTTYKILLEMCSLLGYKFVQNKNTDELFDIVTGIINKKSAVLVLDEADKLEDYDFIYIFLEKLYRKVIFLIANHEERAVSPVVEFRDKDRAVGFKAELVLAQRRFLGGRREEVVAGI